ncbi:hypothetical protein DZG01_00115 [Pseudomonas fluorescens]|nr:hypothetical protein DZG01_00115 [Pseudomonas fluorescens]
MYRGNIGGFLIKAFVARELAPAGLRSDPKLGTACVRLSVGAASQPSGSKLPRHRVLTGPVSSTTPTPSPAPPLGCGAPRRACC